MWAIFVSYYLNNNILALTDLQMQSPTLLLDTFHKHTIIALEYKANSFNNSIIHNHPQNTIASALSITSPPAATMSNTNSIFDGVYILELCSSAILRLSTDVRPETQYYSVANDTGPTTCESTKDHEDKSFKEESITQSQAADGFIAEDFAEYECGCIKRNIFPAGIQHIGSKKEKDGIRTFKSGVPCKRCAGKYPNMSLTLTTPFSLEYLALPES